MLPWHREVLKSTIIATLMTNPESRRTPKGALIYNMANFPTKKINKNEDIWVAGWGACPKFALCRHSSLYQILLYFSGVVANSHCMGMRDRYRDQMEIIVQCRNVHTVWLGYGGCSFVCRYVRITGLLSTPLVNLRIGDWLCILPAITLVSQHLQHQTKRCIDTCPLMYTQQIW